MDPESKLEPYAVPIPEASRLLGDKARSVIYDMISCGKLDAVKDGAKTLIVLESIKRYSASLPPAMVRPPTPRGPRRQTPDRERRMR